MYDYYRCEFIHTENQWHLTLLRAKTFSDAQTESKELIARSDHNSQTIRAVFINSKWRDISNLTDFAKIKIIPQ
jgi:hypothetical protein